jgi:hypothetical protein
MRGATLISGAHASSTQDRMQRLRSLAWLLDDSIPLPGGFRVGLDALIGLIPGLLETVVGAVPFAGDLFDAAFKANMRNLALLERYQRDPIASRRSSRLFVFGFSLLLLLLVATIIAVPVLLITLLIKAF